MIYGNRPFEAVRREMRYYPFHYPFSFWDPQAMKRQQPKYALHKATGQARVRINGKSIYLGPYGSEESRRRYDEIVAEYMKGTLNVS